MFRPGNIRYERLVNPVAVVDGDTESLSGHIIHHPFSHGVGHWFDRHNRYASMEATDLVHEVRQTLRVSDLFSGDKAVQRRALKTMAYRLPGRPLLIFCYLYFFRLGLLDGMPGLRYSIMRSIYEYMIDLKVHELRYIERNPKRNL